MPNGKIIKYNHKLYTLSNHSVQNIPYLTEVSTLTDGALKYYTYTISDHVDIDNFTFSFEGGNYQNKNTIYNKPIDRFTSSNLYPIWYIIDSMTIVGTYNFKSSTNRPTTSIVLSNPCSITLYSGSSYDYSNTYNITNESTSLQYTAIDGSTDLPIQFGIRIDISGTSFNYYITYTTSFDISYRVISLCVDKNMFA